MEIAEERRGGVIILRPEGRIDNTVSDDFQARLIAAVTADVTACIVDFSGVPYITSSGLRAFIAAARAKPAQRHLAVAALGTVVAEIFKITRFTHIVPVFDTVALAEAALSTPP